MSELLKRLARLTRTHVYDLLEQHLPGWRTAPPWQTEHETTEKTEAGPHTSRASFEASNAGGLPYDPELARYYRDLDLPFGAPMQQVTKRWKTYLKKCHPDRYANDLQKQADATRLTQELTQAYEKIKQAWQHHA